MRVIEIENKDFISNRLVDSRRLEIIKAIEELLGASGEPGQINPMVPPLTEVEVSSCVDKKLSPVHPYLHLLQDIELARESYLHFYPKENLPLSLSLSKLEENTIDLVATFNHDKLGQFKKKYICPPPGAKRQ